MNLGKIDKIYDKGISEVIEVIKTLSNQFRVYCKYYDAEAINELYD